MERILLFAMNLDINDTDTGPTDDRIDLRMLEGLEAGFEAPNNSGLVPQSGTLRLLVTENRVAIRFRMESPSVSAQSTDVEGGVWIDRKTGVASFSQDPSACNSYLRQQSGNNPTKLANTFVQQLRGAANLTKIE